MKKYLTSSENMLYYKGKQKGEQMISLILTLFVGCGEEKADDSAQPVEKQQEQQDSAQDTATEIV